MKTGTQDAVRAARAPALAFLFAYLGIDPQNPPLTLLTRFEVLPEAECREGFYVTVGDAPYEVYHLREGGFDVASSDDPTPTFSASTDEERRQQFACLVALHSCGLTLQEASPRHAHVVEPPCATARRWRVTLHAPSASADLVVEVDEFPVGAAWEFVALPHHDLPSPAAGRALLILGCSARKRAAPGLLPAIERYDGPLYRVLRKCLREGTAPQALDILIVSARYGLLRVADGVESYDQRMSGRQADLLREQIGARLAAELSEKTYALAHISLGALYLAALGGVEAVAGCVGQLSLASGGIGQRQAQLRAWLIRASNALGCDPTAPGE